MPVTYSLWLTPQRESTFQDTIIRLAEQYKTNPFPAHVTLTLFQLEPHELATYIQKHNLLFTNQPRIRLCCENLGCHPTLPYTTLYCHIERSNELLELKQRLEGPVHESYMPHMSLLYDTHAKLDNDKRRACIDQLGIGVFSGMSWEADVELWQCDDLSDYTTWERMHRWALR